MKEQNAYFKEVFTSELDRWKKENRKTQEDFAGEIGVNANMIPRYKSGDVYPSTKIDEICRVLGVDKSIFSPQTFFDAFRTSKAVRDNFNKHNFIDKYCKLEEMGIDFSFWSFLWSKIPYTANFFPTSNNPNEEDVLFLEDMPGNVVPIYPQDLEIILDIQADVIEYTTMQLIKRVLNKHLYDAEYHAIKGSFSGEEIDAQLDKIICSMILEISRTKKKEER